VRRRELVNGRIEQLEVRGGAARHLPVGRIDKIRSDEIR
jgi:hypothetical protein